MSTRTPSLCAFTFSVDTPLCFLLKFIHIAIATSTAPNGNGNGPIRTINNGPIINPGVSSNLKTSPASSASRNQNSNNSVGFILVAKSLYKWIPMDHQCLLGDDFHLVMGSVLLLGEVIQ